MGRVTVAAVTALDRRLLFLELLPSLLVLRFSQPLLLVMLASIVLQKVTNKLKGKKRDDKLVNF